MDYCLVFLRAQGMHRRCFGLRLVALSLLVLLPLLLASSKQLFPTGSRVYFMHKGK